MSILDILKSAAETLRKADKIEEYKQILEAQKELLEMQNKVADLEEKNKKLKDELKIKENLIHENNAYWIEKEDGGKDGPFCTRCLGKEGKLMRLHLLPQRDLFSSCPECKNTFQTKAGSYSPYKPKKFNKYI